jgi:hypothetical protein
MPKAVDIIDLLPDSVADLVGVIGWEHALTLVENHGGTPVWVPTKASAGHWLADEIGMAAFTQLCAHYKYSRLDLPRCTALLKSVRNQSIISEFNGGATNSQLARKYKTTERHIRRIRQLAIGQQPPDNLDLFNDFLTI